MTAEVISLAKVRRSSKSICMLHLVENYNYSTVVEQQYGDS